jgi:hypothetical protein
VVALLVPRIREEDQHLVERARRDRLLEHLDRVVRDHAQVRQPRVARGLQQATDAGAMHLDAEVVALAMRGRERREVLAVAEADLERERRDAAEDGREVEGAAADRSRSRRRARARTSRAAARP